MRPQFPYALPPRKHPRPTHVVKESWWTTAPPEGFTRAAEAQTQVATSTGPSLDRHPEEPDAP